METTLQLKLATYTFKIIADALGDFFCHCKYYMGILLFPIAKMQIVVCGHLYCSIAVRVESRALKV
jgi:hypothetical protein